MENIRENWTEIEFAIPEGQFGTGRQGCQMVIIMWQHHRSGKFVCCGMMIEEVWIYPSASKG